VPVVGLAGVWIVPLSHLSEINLADACTSVLSTHHDHRVKVICVIDHICVISILTVLLLLVRRKRRWLLLDEARLAVAHEARAAVALV